jgi:hypothetical protein
MRTTLLLLAIFASAAFAAEQTVWKWVDERGVTHYSDRPVPGATKLELNIGRRASDTDNATPSASSTFDRPDSTAAGPTYRNFEIWKPADGESLINTGGAVSVNVRIDPPLQPGHGLSLYLDGRLVGDGSNATEYSLTEVPRGVHSVMAVVTDRRGQRLQETAPVRFNVRQESIASPPVGPALRPPPKPRPRG